MLKRLFSSLTVVVCLWAVAAAAPAGAQTCEPLDNGRMVDVFYQGTSLFFEPVIEYRKMVLTITGPCEDIVRTFGPNDTISFDIREIQRVTDGTYTWQLRRVAADPGLEEELQSLRGSGKEDAVWWQYFQSGQIPAGPYVDSGSFTVFRGEIIDPNSGEEKSATLAGKASGGGSSSAVQASLAGGTTAGESGESGGPVLSTKDFLINDDLIVFGSTCIGFDCVNGEVFGFDTLRLKENNLRIHFNDTSTAASFPTTNWQIRANSSANGGESFLGFIDHGANGESEGGTRVFAVEAGAGSNALFVESGGDVGMGTGNPALNIHVVDGDSPGLRLEQDGSSGFAPQIWDIAGNETNFFVRDVTSGSLLPLRIRPGAASSSIFIDSDSDVGIGTSSPAGTLHVENTSSDDEDDFVVTSNGQLAIGSTTAGSLPTLMKLANPNAGVGGGDVRFVLENSSGDQWSFTNDNVGAGELEINYIPNAGTEVLIDGSGNITATSFNPTSSRTLKTDVEPIEPKDILARLSELPLSTWRFVWEDGTRHLGPMAEEFKAAFGLGNSDKSINLTDAAGVAFAAIQGLRLEVSEKEEEIANLMEQNAELLERLERLEAGLKELAAER